MHTIRVPLPIVQVEVLTSKEARAHMQSPQVALHMALHTISHPTPLVRPARLLFILSSPAAVTLTTLPSPRGVWHPLVLKPTLIRPPAEANPSGLPVVIIRRRCLRDRQAGLVRVQLGQDRSGYHRTAALIVSSTCIVTKEHHAQRVTYPPRLVHG